MLPPRRNVEWLGTYPLETLSVLPSGCGHSHNVRPVHNGFRSLRGRAQEAWLTVDMLKSGTRSVGMAVRVK
jgi:hypothetical protein